VANEPVDYSPHQRFPCLLTALNSSILDSSIRLDMVMPLDSPQPNFAIHSLADVQDSFEDKPVPGLALVSLINLEALYNLGSH
jgi:hypothetical protein